MLYSISWCAILCCIMVCYVLLYSVLWCLVYSAMFNRILSNDSPTNILYLPLWCSCRSSLELSIKKTQSQLLVALPALLTLPIVFSLLPHYKYIAPISIYHYCITYTPFQLFAQYHPALYHISPCTIPHTTLPKPEPYIT